MLRIHLAQVHFNPAYFDAPVDFLEEPYPPASRDEALGAIRSEPGVAQFLAQSRAAYVDHVSAKVVQLAEWSAANHAHILVFPEYAVPAETLPKLRECAIRHSLIIVAGSHRVHLERNGDIYRAIGCSVDDSYNGAAVSPVITSDGRVVIQPKLGKSKWEANLRTPAVKPLSIPLVVDGHPVRMTVLLCIDVLMPGLLGSLWQGDERDPHIIVCPSLSPTTDPYRSVGETAAANEAVLAFVNDADFGGTRLNVPPAWRSFLVGLQPHSDAIPPHSEAILEQDFDPGEFFLKRGTTRSVKCSHARLFPITYKEDGWWYTQVGDLRRNVLLNLRTQNSIAAQASLDRFLANSQMPLPELFLKNLKHVRYQYMPLFDGAVDSLTAALTCATLSRVQGTNYHRSTHVKDALAMLSDLLRSSAEPPQAFWSALQAMKAAQRRLPTPPDTNSKGVVEQRPAADQHSVGDADRAWSFQNREDDLDRIGWFLANPELRVLILSGAIGVGKTELTNVAFRKRFRDWVPNRIHVPAAVSPARIVAELGYRVGHSVDIDSLAAASLDVFRETVRSVLSAFDTGTKRVVVIDDLHHIARGPQKIEERQLDLLLEECAAVPSAALVKTILISSRWIPQSWLNVKGVVHERLRPLDDASIRRTLEFLAGAEPEETRERLLRQSVLDLVRGNPLSARLAYAALREKPPGEQQWFAEVSRRVARELLQHFDLTTKQRQLLGFLSCFRVPPVEHELAITLTQDESVTLRGLFISGVIVSDGSVVEMHEAIRRYYYDMLSSNELTDNHRRCAAHYLRAHNVRRPSLLVSPTTLCEIAYHATMVGDLPTVQQFRLLVMDELRPAARRVYKELRDYARALSIYRLIVDVIPHDVVSLAYIGRCFARLGQWLDSDEYFERALRSANIMGGQRWWIFRDWGHIRSRYGYYAIAAEHFDTAESMNPQDAAIKAARAVMWWKQGDTRRACTLFDEALDLNPYHMFTLDFYARMLEGMGEFELADTLSRRRRELETEPRDAEDGDGDLEGE